MEARETLDLDALNASLANADDARTGATPGRPARQLVMFNPDTAGADAQSLARVAKLIASMTPEGRRACLCWLVGYFDPQID